MKDDFNLPLERPSALIHAPIITVQQHILQEQRRFSRRFGRVLLAALRHHAGHEAHRGQGPPRGALRHPGFAGDINVQGEVQQKLDVYANEMLLHALSVAKAWR